MHPPTSPRPRVVRCAAAACLVAALVGATPDGPPAAAPSPLTRQGIAEFVKDARRLASLRKGVKKMRELDARDPRSWVFQANIHARPRFPDYVYEQARAGTRPEHQLFRDDLGFTPSPNVFEQCPHMNWWFLPWHRAYVYYFEHILRWAAEDPTLTVPYWNYEDDSQRELPPAFREEKTADGQDNPLYLPASAAFRDAQGQAQIVLMRDLPLLRGDGEVARAAGSLGALADVPFTSPSPLLSDLGFGGPQAPNPAAGLAPGALEATPHNLVHRAVGGGDGVRGGFMAANSTAARDPVFWLHHSNIDRLWASWYKLGGGRKHPDDPAWLRQAFTFYDVDKAGTPRPVTVRVQDLLTTEQLGYVYDRLERLPEVVVSAPPPVPGGGGGPTMTLAAADLSETVGPRQAGGIRLKTTKAVTLFVPLHKGTKAEQVRSLAGLPPGKRRGHLVLALEGIAFDQPPAVDYEVYVNLPAGVKPSPDSAFYVGPLTFFGMAHPAGGHGHKAPPASRDVGLRLPGKLLAALPTDARGRPGVNVTFVPTTWTEPARRGAEAPRRAERDAVTIRRVRLLHAP